MRRAVQFLLRKTSKNYLREHAAGIRFCNGASLQTMDMRIISESP